MIECGRLLAEIRRKKPLIHHITNMVTMGDCADATSAIGALPVMAQARDEVKEMVSQARAAVINIGTLDPHQVEAMLEMGRQARERGIPLVLDPVGAGASSYRTSVAWLLLKETAPSIIKGNGAEIGSLAGLKEARIKGVHSLNAGGDPFLAAGKLLSTLGYRAVVIVTGAEDAITDGKRRARVLNGNVYLPLVVGSGCMAASLVASFAAVAEDHFQAAAAAMATLGVAGEIAARVKEDEPFSGLGPAGFKVRLLDALFGLTPDELDKRARIEVQ